MSKRVYTDYEINYIKDNYINLSYREIAKHLGITRSAVSGRVFRMKPANPKSARAMSWAKTKKNPIDIELLKQYAAAGLSIKQTAQRMKVGKHVVKTRAEKHGVLAQFRANGQAAQLRGSQVRGNQLIQSRSYTNTFTRKFSKPFNAPGAGYGINLKSGKQFLHMDGTKLTDKSTYAWRGLDRQVQPMIDACGIDSLTPVMEVAQ